MTGEEMFKAFQQRLAEVLNENFKGELVSPRILAVIKSRIVAVLEAVEREGVFTGFEADMVRTSATIDTEDPTRVNFRTTFSDLEGRMVSIVSHGAVSVAVVDEATQLRGVGRSEFEAAAALVIELRKHGVTRGRDEQPRQLPQRRDEEN